MGRGPATPLAVPFCQGTRRLRRLLGKPLLYHLAIPFCAGEADGMEIEVLTNGIKDSDKSVAEASEQREIQALTKGIEDSDKSVAACLLCI